MKRTNLEMLTLVAKALGSLRDQVVFVGGTTVQFYATFFATKLAALKSRGMSELRMSKDLEDIVFVLNYRTSS